MEKIISKTKLRKIKEEDYEEIKKFIYETRMEHFHEGFKKTILYNAKLQVILNLYLNTFYFTCETFDEFFNNL